MTKINTKHFIVLISIIGLLLNVATPGLTQIFPGWGNHEPGGIGNTPPPNGQEFVRQNPMPENMQDITIYASNKNGIKLKVEFPDVFDYELATGDDGKTYRRYKASSEFKVIGNIGEPEILYRAFCLQIPRDANNIKIESTEHYLKDTKNENVNLYPIPEIIFEKDPDGLMGSKEVFAIDEEFYEKDKNFPEAQAQIVEEGFKHDLRLIRIAVPVMTYNPKAKITQEIKTVKLTITYESQKENKISINAQKDPFHKVFNATLANYTYHNIKPSMGTEMQGGIKEIRGEDLINPEWANQNDFYPDFLVIAAKVFDEEASEPLQTWAQHRAFTEEGGQHNVAIAYVDEIVNAYPAPGLEAEQIKAFIEMVYTNWRTLEAKPNLNFLMLVGDADMGGNSNSWFLSTWRSTPEAGDTGDNDYSWLVGNDTLDDLMLGRLPAKNEEELSIMVNKTINFETNPPQGENHYGTRSLMLYGDMYLKTVTPPEASTNTRNLLLSKKQELDEFHTNYLKNLPDFKYDSDTATQILNTAGALFVGYNAHGSTTGGWGPNVNVFNLENFNKLPVTVLALTCNTAGFDHESSNAYSEKWIKHENGGSVSYWGSTRVATNDPESHTNFFSSVFGSNISTLGAAINLVRARFSGNTATVEKHRKIYNLLGDPSIDFSAYIGESTKPDLTNVQTISNPENPEFYNQNMSTISSFKNNSNQELDNILIKLYSLESSEKNTLVNWTCSLPAQGYEYANFDWSYTGESSRHIMTWVDPDNNIEELSEFNNWLNSEIKYFPIYVDADNNTGVEHGTQQEPFKKLNTAISHAFEHDLIGDDDCRPDRWKAVEIKLGDGTYGDGSEIETGSLVLKSEHGAKKTVVLDSLKINGSSYHIEGITFKGGNGQDSAISIRQSKNTSQNNDMHMLIRNIFTKWDGYALDINQQDFPHPFPQTCHKLNNNLFHNNFGTIYANAKQNVQLFIANNTFSNNENNLFLISPVSQNSSIIKKEINLSLRNNIMWNTGETSGAGAFPERISFFYKQYNDINDTTFWEEFGLNETNINDNPKFRNSGQNDFHLNSDSPCINTGNPYSNYNDPDGSRNDMGTYGGPEAVLRPIRIISPIHGQTLQSQAQPPFEYELNIKWDAYQLNPQDLVNINIYHREYEFASPDKGITDPYYIGKKVIDLDVLTENNNIYSTIIEQIAPTQSYWLTITNHDNPEEFEKINFKISSENQSIYNNR